jgi:oligopeptide transport system ATP-binding protein
MEPDELRRLRRRAQIVFQDPFASLNPRMTVGDMIREVLACTGSRGARRRARVRELLDLVGLARPRRPLPPRVQRRPAPAHRHRPRAVRRAGLHRVRRAGLRPRRVRPGPGAQPARVAAGEARPRLPLHRPRPERRRARQRPHRRHVPRPIVEMGDAPDVIVRCPATRTRGRCSPPCPSPSRARSASGSCCPATCPAHRPAPGCPFHPRCQHPLKDADCAAIVPPLAEKAPGHFAACIKEPSYPGLNGGENSGVLSLYSNYV